MKNILFLSILVAIQASMAFADEASEQLKASARQVIQAGVDNDIAAEVTRVLLLNGFKEEQVLRAHAILIKAQRAGLPLQPIVNKAFEGIAKQVSPDTTLMAMDAVLSRYDFAFSRADSLSTRTEQKNRLGQALAAGIAAGVSLEDADAMVEAVRQRAAATNPDQAADLALAAFETARDAARLGVSSTAAAGLVTQAMSKSLSLAEMQAMHQSFLSQSQHALPENIAKSYSSAIQQGKSFQGHGAVPGGLHGTPGHSSGHGGAGSTGTSGGAGGAGSGGGPGGSGGGAGGAGGGGGGGSGGGGSGGGGSGGGGGGR